MSLEKHVWALFFFEWEDLISCGHTFSQFFLPIAIRFSCCHAAPHSFFLCDVTHDHALAKYSWLVRVLRQCHWQILADPFG